MECWTWPPTNRLTPHCSAGRKAETSKCQSKSHEERTVNRPPEKPTRPGYIPPTDPATRFHCVLAGRNLQFLQIPQFRMPFRLLFFA